MASKAIKQQFPLVQKALGAKLQLQRTLMEMSQQKVADSCGLHRSHYSAIECGKENVTLLTLMMIAEVLQTNVSALLHEIA